MGYTEILCLLVEMSVPLYAVIVYLVEGVYLKKVITGKYGAFYSLLIVKKPRGHDPRISGPEGHDPQSFCPAHPAVIPTSQGDFKIK